MKKIYIAGKITGIEDQAVALFDGAARWLSGRGYEAVNPMLLGHDHDQRWESYMKVCLKALIDCDAIYLIDNWRDSRGAVVEYNLALMLGMEILKQEHPSK